MVQAEGRWTYSQGTDPLWLSFPDYKAYIDAAEEFHPYIPFFATFDSKVRTFGFGGL